MLMQNPNTLGAFASWCDKKGNERYDYFDTDRCACAQYSKSIGQFDDFRDRMPYHAEHIWCYSGLAQFWGVVDAIASQHCMFKTLADSLRRFENTSYEEIWNTHGYGR